MKEKFNSSRENEALLRHFEFRRKHECWDGPWYRMTVPEIVNRLEELTCYHSFNPAVIEKLLSRYNCPEREREDGKRCFVLREKAFRPQPPVINITITITAHEKDI